MMVQCCHTSGSMNRRSTSTTSTRGYGMARQLQTLQQPRLRMPLAVPTVARYTAHLPLQPLRCAWSLALRCNLLEGGHGRQWDVEFRVHALGERQTQFACLLQCCEEALACVLYRVVSGEHKGLECGQLGGMVGVVGGGCGGVLVCG